jgi:hypothetical protein
MTKGSSRYIQTPEHSQTPTQQHISSGRRGGKALAPKSPSKMPGEPEALHAEGFPNPPDSPRGGSDHFPNPPSSPRQAPKGGKARRPVLYNEIVKGEGHEPPLPKEAFPNPPPDSARGSRIRARGGAKAGKYSASGEAEATVGGASEHSDTASSASTTPTHEE